MHNHSPFIIRTRLISHSPQTIQAANHSFQRSTRKFSKITAPLTLPYDLALWPDLQWVSLMPFPQEKNSKSALCLFAKWLCCDRKSRAACAQSFAPWEQATIEIMLAISLTIACSRHVHMMMLFFTHMPFVVNHTINATPPERLQQLNYFQSLSREARLITPIGDEA